MLNREEGDDEMHGAAEGEDEYGEGEARQKGGDAHVE